jgi:hypothetical protein
MKKYYCKTSMCFEKVNKNGDLCFKCNDKEQRVHSEVVKMKEPLEVIENDNLLKVIIYPRTVEIHRLDETIDIIPREYTEMDRISEIAIKTFGLGDDFI